MGASNVAAVYVHWSALRHQPFRLLAYMANVSLDRDDPPRFWGGRDDLAYAIGMSVPREPDDDDRSEEAEVLRRRRKASYEAVRVGLAELKAVGAISIAKAARLGTRAEYRLHLTQAQSGAKTQAKSGPAIQAESGSAAGSTWSLTQTEPGPKEKTGGVGVQTGEDPVPASPYVADDQAEAEQAATVASGSAVLDLCKHGNRSRSCVTCMQVTQVDMQVDMQDVV